MFERLGARAVAIHGRTRAQQRKGEADWSSICRAKGERYSGDDVRLIKGIVSSRFRAAGRNLKTVEDKILARTGFVSIATGTLNVTIDYDYIVRADVTIEPHEYFTGERLKFQRCRVRGFRMFIMRPDSHERPGGIGANVLELVSPMKLGDLWGFRDGDPLEIEVEGDDHWWNQQNPDLPHFLRLKAETEWNAPAGLSHLDL